MGDVILIGHNDCETGIAEKLYTHKKGILHRAVYVYIYNSDGELFYRKKHLENIILSSFGVIYLVHIHSRENRIYLQLTED